MASRALGTVDASLLVVGSIVGAGIFLVSPDVAQEVNSRGAFLMTWVFGGVVALCGALSNGELGSLFPRSGGEYVYLREAYGPLFGFLSGWTSFWIAFPGSIAALAAGFGAAIGTVFNVTRPGFSVAIGVAVIAALTGVNALGLKPGKGLVNVLSLAKLAAFVVLLAIGLFARGTAPAHLGVPREAGAGGGIAIALVSTFFAYSGWNSATYVAGEMREPTRGLGKALALGTLMCAVLYVIVNVVYLRAMPLAELASLAQGGESPAHVAARRLGGAGAEALLDPLVALCILSALQSTVLVGPHIYRAMALDDVFFAPFAKLSPKTNVPLLSLLVQGVIAAIELMSGGFEQLITFVMFPIIAFSALAVAAVFVFRVRRPDARRPFPVPGFPVVPALFVLVNGWVMWNVLAHGKREALVGLFVVSTGIPAYFAFRAATGRSGGSGRRRTPC